MRACSRALAGWPSATTSTSHHTNRSATCALVQNERHKRILSQLLKLEENRKCADCGARGPTWASVNLGVFVCLNCSGEQCRRRLGTMAQLSLPVACRGATEPSHCGLSATAMLRGAAGVHRSLGVHNSKVRSTNLDTWLPEQVAFVQAMGNARGNAYWEANLPRDFRRPPEQDMEALRAYITDKYINKLYALRDYREPPSIENYSTHPVRGRGVCSWRGILCECVLLGECVASLSILHRVPYTVVWCRRGP